ncbi:hypothetical protein [Paenibacillus gansuensis]|uniref:DUF2125 domain-containing protein n=1 Tax=Paenibacillus gansuensis TaxID=306542 RepID=A0ABW5P7F3_9BACL
MSNTLIRTGTGLFNLLLSKYTDSNKQDFGGNKIVDVLQMEMVYGLQGPPTVSFSQDPSGGIKISFLFSQMQLQLFEYRNGERGNLQGTYQVPVTVTGLLALKGSAFTMTNLEAVPAAVGSLDEKVAKLFNEQIVPQFQKQMSSVPLPDLGKVIGVPIAMQGLYLENGALHLQAQAGGSGGNAVLPPEPETGAVIAVAIASDFIHDMAASGFPGASAHAGAKKSKSGFGYDGEARASADQTNVWIADGAGYGTLRVSASAKGGIEVFGKWVEPDISVSTHTPALNLKLITDHTAHKAIAKVSMDGSVSFDFGLPGVLEKAADSILSLIKPLAGEITNAINAGLDQVNITMFTLPEQVPGTDLSAGLNFRQLGFYGNSAYAVIEIA